MKCCFEINPKIETATMEVAQESGLTGKLVFSGSQSHPEIVYLWDMLLRAAVAPSASFLQARL
jgi:hypothetical protein